MTRRSRWIWTGVGILTAVGALSALTYRVARAAGRPQEPRYPGSPTGPLRPDPPASSPGELAVRLADLIGGISDKELQAARLAMPSHWWTAILSATQAKDDDDFAVAFSPIGNDLSKWTIEQREQLRSDLLSSIGVFNTLELRALLGDAGIAV